MVASMLVRFSGFGRAGLAAGGAFCFLGGGAWAVDCAAAFAALDAGASGCWAATVACRNKRNTITVHVFIFVPMTPAGCLSILKCSVSYVSSAPTASSF